MLTVPPNHSKPSSDPACVCTWWMVVPSPTPFMVSALSSLPKLTSNPAYSMRVYTMVPELSLRSVPPYCPELPSPTQSPAGKLQSDRPFRTMPPQSPLLLSSGGFELVKTTGSSSVPSEKSLPPARTISALGCTSAEP